MAVKIRLRRLGRKKKPVYRMVVATETSPRDGKVVEEIGFYDPLQEPAIFNYDEDRVKFWLGNGAQPTEAVERLLGNVGLFEANKRKSPFEGLSKKDRKELKEKGYIGDVDPRAPKEEAPAEEAVADAAPEEAVVEATPEPEAEKAAE